MMTYPLPFRVIALLFGVFWFWGILLGGGFAHGQLRVVSYNSLGGPRAGTETILRSMGEESRNGIAKPLDVLLLQEQDGPFGDTQAFVDLLNGMYEDEGITYARGDVIGGPFSPNTLRQTIVYNSQTVELTSEAAFGSTGGSNQARQALRYQLRPSGYDSTAEFYIYNSHYKAGDSSSDAARRNAEANNIRNNSDALGEGSYAIYAGDHNIYRSNESAWQTLTSAGAGQAHDPVDQVGIWHDNASFADVHTQSPCNGAGCVGTGGGMDDRFDFQLVTGEFLDGEGLSYIGPTTDEMIGLQHSYHTFGNNGSTYNDNINFGNTISFPGVTSHSKSEILDALWASSDHLPVVADYQIPAKMEAILSAVPETLVEGEEFSLELMVRNAAEVVAVNGADELDFSVRSAELGGALLDFSAFSQVDDALGGGVDYDLPLDTTSPGLKFDVLEVASGSPGVQNQYIEFPIEYEVLAAGLIGDYNQDDVVDAADYTYWRDRLGQATTLPNEDPSATPGQVTYDDYLVWKQQFGTTAGSGAPAGGAVPEPAGAALLLVGLMALPRQRCS